MPRHGGCDVFAFPAFQGAQNQKGQSASSGKNQVTQRRRIMRTEARWLFAAVLRSILVLLAMTAGQRVALAQAQHVRWDIINVDFTTAPPTTSAGGIAFATARNPASLKIKLTGPGASVPPAGRASPSAVP